MKTATNRKPCNCDACEVRIDPGRAVVWRDVDGVWHKVCRACAETGRTMPVPPEQGELDLAREAPGPAPAAPAVAPATPEARAAAAGLGPEAAEAERARERAVERARREAEIELGAAARGSPRAVAGIIADVFCPDAPATKAGNGVTANLARLALLDPGLGPRDRESVSALILTLEPRSVARAEMVFEAPEATIRELEWFGRRGLKALIRAVRLALEIPDGAPCAVEVRPIGAIEQERKEAA